MGRESVKMSLKSYRTNAEGAKKENSCFVALASQAKKRDTRKHIQAHPVKRAGKAVVIHIV